MEHLAAQWRRAVTPLHDTRVGTPPKVEGDSLSAILSGRRGVVMYDRTTDTLHVSAAEPGKHVYPDNDVGHMPDERRQELKERYTQDSRMDWVSFEWRDGFGLRLDAGHIEPYNGGRGGAPTRATMFNPLGVEALARLLDAEPAFGRWMTHEQQEFYGDRGRSYTARDWVARFNDLRTTLSSLERTANSWSSLTFYHGTCAYWWKQIRQVGLRPRSETGMRGGWSDKALSHDGRVYLAVRGNNILKRAMQEATESAIFNAFHAEVQHLLGAGSLEETEHGLQPYRWVLDRWGKGETQWGDRDYGSYGKVRDNPSFQRQCADLAQRLREAEYGRDPDFAHALIEVEVPRSHWGRFEADEDTYEYSIPGSGEVGLPEWLFSLGVDAVVAYRGTIPPAWMRLV